MSAFTLHPRTGLLNRGLPAAVILLALCPRVGPAAQPLAVPFQLSHAQNMDARPSPDGTQLVYISVVAGVEQLLTARVDGSSAAQITHDTADHEDPAWSPDGRRIAFVVISGEDKRIYVANADGSAGRPVSPPDVRAIHPEWSADGKRLIYCTDDDLRPPHKNPSHIDVLDLVSGRVSTLISGGINTYPQWSPDMRRLVFRKIIGERNSEVFVADADGGNPRNITNDPAFDGWPAWSPDGQLIAFASNRNGSGYQIFIMDPDGADVRLVANTVGRATSPRWSPDGRQIYFTNCVPKDFGTDCEILVAKLPEVRSGRTTP
jgi:TolB protein